LQEDVRRFSRFLICSNVGEPGKVDVLVGGRLARLVGAEVTVLHAGGNGAAGSILGGTHIPVLIVPMKEMV
jgi:hypothetical protein